MATLETQPVQRSGLPVAVDAMGGDKGLEIRAEGAVLAYKEYGVRSILVGPQEDLKSKLDALGAKHFPVTVRNATETIAMHESPVRAVRRKPDSSLCVAFELADQGVASSVISAGNSGAMMAAGRLICGLLPGIERPAITTIIPSAGEGRPNAILDTGANVDCHARNLVQFAIMGSIYYSTLFKVEKPKVGLLSNGTEQSKGTDVIRAASMILSQMEAFEYVGFVEGRDVATQVADVIVCDGFVGNVLLKSMEGCVRLIFQQLMYESEKGLFRKLGLGLSKGVYREVFAHKFDYTAHGGSPLLGMQQIAVVLHGSSGSRAVKNAIRVADAFHQHKMIDKLAVALAHYDESTAHLDDDILPEMFSKNGALSSKKNKKNANGRDSARSTRTPRAPRPAKGRRAGRGRVRSAEADEGLDALLEDEE